MLALWFFGMKSALQIKCIIIIVIITTCFILFWPIWSCHIIHPSLAYHLILKGGSKLAPFPASVARAGGLNSRLFRISNKGEDTCREDREREEALHWVALEDAAFPLICVDSRPSHGFLWKEPLQNLYQCLTVNGLFLGSEGVVPPEGQACGEHICIKLLTEKTGYASFSLTEFLSDWQCWT